MAEWISVKERLPEYYTDVAAIVRNGNTSRYILTYLAVGGIWAMSCGERIDGVVTHWMPLPEPPKESNSLGKPENCEYYTTSCFGGGGGCLGTREIDPCEGKGCKRYKPKMDGGAEDG